MGKVRGVLKFRKVHDSLHSGISDEGRVPEPVLVLGRGGGHGLGVIVFRSCCLGLPGGIILPGKSSGPVGVAEQLLHLIAHSPGLGRDDQHGAVALGENDRIIQHLHAFGAVKLKGGSLHLSSCVQGVGQDLDVHAVGRDEHAYLLGAGSGGIGYGIISDLIGPDAVIVIESVCKALVVRGHEQIGAFKPCRLQRRRGKILCGDIDFFVVTAAGAER